MQCSLKTSQSRPGLYGDNGFEYEPGIKLMKGRFMGDAVDLIKTLPMEVGDVVIATYPKAGTTWMQEMLWQIHLSGEPTEVYLFDRVCHIEGKDPGGRSGVDKTVEKPHPWLMKSHLPSSIFQKQLSEGKARFVVVMRNVKDSLVSYYHYHRARAEFCFDGTWDDFFEHFKAKELMWGDWLEYNLSWLAYRDHPNVLIVKYEEMKQNRREIIRKVASFCQKPLSEDVLNTIAEATSFETMKGNPSTNYRSQWHPHFMNFDISPFMRKGMVGDWKNYFTDDQNARTEHARLMDVA